MIVRCTAKLLNLLGKRTSTLVEAPPSDDDWYANLLVDPEFTFHLKGSVQADLPAIAHPITDEAQRREVIHGIREDLGRGHSGEEEWVARSPLVEVEFPKVPLDPHEEQAQLFVLVLVGVQNVSPMAVDKVGDSGQNALAVRAID